MPFLPKNYSVPKASGNYMRLEKGENKFRILSDQALIGYEYWTAENKPVRLREFPMNQPNDMREDSKMKEFWIFVVWNYANKKVQILELTQTSIKEQLQTYVDDPDFGEPMGFDIVVKRSGDGLETKYSTIAKPPTDIPKEALEAYDPNKIDLEVLFDSGDPFLTDKKVGSKLKNEEKVEIEDLPE